MSELSLRGLLSFHYLCHRHETNSSICCFSSICSRLSFPASFLFASSSTFCCHTSGFEHGPHFLDLIPSSCLLPALSHRGQGWDPKGKGKWRTSWEHPQQVEVKTTESLQEQCPLSFFPFSSMKCLTLQYVIPTHFFIISENADCLLCLLYL